MTNIHIHLSKRNFVFLLVFLILLLAIPLTVFVALQVQDTRQRAAEPGQEIIAEVNGQPITESVLRTFASSQYAESAIDQKALQVMLNQLIEQMLVEDEAAVRNLVATDEEIDANMVENGLDAFLSIQDLRNQARIKVLKRKIELSLTKTVEAYTVGYWITPPGYGIELTAEQEELTNSQRAINTQALDFIEARIQAGEEPLDVGIAASEQFPSLASLMAVNGYKLESAEGEDTSLFTKPVIYSFQKGRANVLFFKTLFELSPGDIAVVQDTEANDGGVVIKMVGETTGQYNNYTDWLGAKKKEDVVILRSP